MTDEIKKPKVETLPQTQQNNIYIQPELAQAMLAFLGRTQIQGQEAEAMVAAKATLQRITIPQTN